MGEESASPVSIQARLYPDATCFGCGLANPKGLHLQSYAQEAAVVATFTPWPEHDNGLGYLNGGIIATLLDCHSGAAVLHEADRRGWEAFPGAAYSFVTAGLDVRYLRPAPLLGARRAAGGHRRGRRVRHHGRRRARLGRQAARGGVDAVEALAPAHLTVSGSAG